MRTRSTNHAPTRPPVLPSDNPIPLLLFAILAQEARIRRIEQFNAQLARENDRLSRELREGKRAA